MYMKIFYIPDGPTQKIVDDLWWTGFLIHIPQLLLPSVQSWLVHQQRDKRERKFKNTFTSTPSCDGRNLVTNLWKLWRRFSLSTFLTQDAVNLAEEDSVLLKFSSYINPVQLWQVY